MKIAVTGSGGMLGHDIKKVFSDVELAALTRRDFDITDLDSAFSSIKEIKPDYLIHSAAYTDVDGSEHDPEKAYLINGIGTRKTAKALGMSTEASFRFERGVDPEGTLWAAHRAAYLIRKLAGGTILSGTIDVYPKPIIRRPVVVRPKRVNCFLGTSLKKKEISFCLERLGIAVNGKGKDALECAAPSWRWDLDREEDMMEEVARIYGFQNIPLSMPTYTSAPDRTGESHNRLRAVCGLMNTSGFTEVVTMSFNSKSEAGEFLEDGNKDDELALLNPISEEHVVMRTSLIPGLLSVMKRNVSFKIEDLRIFELGKAFLARPGQDLPVEELRVAGLATGSRYPGIWHFQRGEVDSRGKIDNIREVDFHDIKGAIENLFEGLGVSDVKFIPSKKPFLHRGKSADLVLEGQTIGFAGQLSPAKIREHDLSGNVQIFEILLEPLFIRWCKESVFKPIPRYPYIERDLSFIVEEKVSGDVIKHLISRLGHDIITSVVLFDLYRGETIPKGYQSMAFRIRYQSEDRTLTDEDAQEVHQSVAEALVREVDAKMRE